MKWLTKIFFLLVIKLEYERKPKNTKTQVIINFTEFGCQINTRPQNVKNYFMVTFLITD